MWKKWLVPSEKWEAWLTLVGVYVLHTIRRC